MKKPPLGAIPRWVWEDWYFDDTSSILRENHLREAIERFRNIGKEPHMLKAWVDELREIEEIKKPLSL